MKLTKYKNINVFELSFLKKDVSFFLVNNIPVRYIGNQYKRVIIVYIVTYIYYYAR